MAINSLISLGDIDLLELSVSPLLDPITASQGSLSIVSGSGDIYQNDNGVWKFIPNISHIQEQNLPKYYHVTSETPIVYCNDGIFRNLKIDIIGEGVVDIVDPNLSFLSTVRGSGFWLNSPCLRFIGRNENRVDTLSYVRRSVSLSSYPWSDGNVYDMWMSIDGRWCYLVGSSRDRVLWGELTTPYDISTLTKMSSELNVATYESTVSGIFLSPDRVHLYICGTVSKNITHFILSTPGDPATAVFQSSVNVNGIESVPNSVILSSDGSNIYFIGASNDTVFQYELSTPWILSTIGTVDVGQLNIHSQEGTPTGMSFNNSMTKMYIVGTSRDSVFEYLLNVAGKVETAEYTGRRFYVGSQESNPHGVFVVGPNLDDRLYVVGISSDKINEYHFNRTAPDFEVVVTPLQI